LQNVDFHSYVFTHVAYGWEFWSVTLVPQSLLIENDIRPPAETNASASRRSQIALVPYLLAKLSEKRLTRSAWFGPSTQVSS